MIAKPRNLGAGGLAGLEQRVLGRNLDLLAVDFDLGIGSSSKRPSGASGHQSSVPTAGRAAIGLAFGIATSARVIDRLVATSRSPRAFRGVPPRTPASILSRAWSSATPSIVEIADRSRSADETMSVARIVCSCSAAGSATASRSRPLQESVTGMPSIVMPS